jgi:hypothetical protein
VNDTSSEMERMVTERYKLMTPDQRMKIASSMFETARAIIESSLPPTLSRRERRLAYARRLYAGELLDVALVAGAMTVQHARRAKFVRRAARHRTHAVASGSRRAGDLEYRVVTAASCSQRSPPEAPRFH